MTVKASTKSVTISIWHTYTFYTWNISISNNMLQCIYSKPIILYSHKTNYIYILLYNRRLLTVLKRPHKSQRFLFLIISLWQCLSWNQNDQFTVGTAIKLWSCASSLSIMFINLYIKFRSGIIESRKWILFTLKASNLSSFFLLNICLFLLWLRLRHGIDCCTPILTFLPIMSVCFIRASLSI